MSITGSLADFSLPEIFQFLQKGRRTGLLTLRGLPQAQATPLPVHYIWVYKGHIVVAANRLDQQGLISLIEQFQVVSDRVLDRLIHWCCPIQEPLGLYLKQQGVLQAEQLKRLFNIQVLQPVAALFQLKDGEFKFEQNVPIPTREMTGLMVAAGALNQYDLIQVLVKNIDKCCLNSKPLIATDAINRPQSTAA